MPNTKCKGGRRFTTNTSDIALSDNLGRLSECTSAENSKKSVCAISEKNDKQDCSICKTDVSTDFSIECDICGGWFHGKCVGLSKKQFEVIVGLGSSLKWLCPECSIGDSVVVKSPVDLPRDSIGSRIDSLERTVSKLADSISIGHSCKRSVEKTYSDVVRAGNIQSKAQENDPPKPKLSETSETLIVKGVVDRKKYDSFPSIREVLNKDFPKIRLLSAHYSPKRLLFLKVVSQDDVERLLKGWKNYILGANTSIVRYDPEKRQRNYVVLKNVPTALIESEILSEVKAQFSGCCEAKRFHKQGAILKTVRIAFDKKEQMSSALSTGLFLADCFYMPELYQEKKFPIRCYNCNHFGHTSHHCTAKQSCLKCSAHGHSIKDCTSDTIKCCNCNGNHLASDRDCPLFLNLFKRMNFLA